MKTYPIMLDLRGRKVVVVGAGAVGIRKVRSLTEAGADVTLVDERRPQAHAPAGATTVWEAYDPNHLKGATLVMACTDDRDLNARIAADARKAGALVNAADEPEHCDFYLPAVADDGDVVLAVGTGGASPALAGELRDRLAAALPDRIGEFAAALLEAREQLKASACPPAQRGQILRRLAGEAVYREFLDRGAEAIRERLRKMTPGG